VIKVEVALFATLSKYNPAGESTEPFTLQFPEGSTVEDVLKRLQIPPQESKQVFVDSHRRDRDYVLKEGERVAIFPPIAGGGSFLPLIKGCVLDGPE